MGAIQHEAAQRFIEVAQNELKNTKSEIWSQGNTSCTVMVTYYTWKIPVEFRHSRCSVQGVYIWRKKERSVTYSSLSATYPIERLKVLIERMDEYQKREKQRLKDVAEREKISKAMAERLSKTLPKEADYRIRRNSFGRNWLEVKYKGFFLEIAEDATTEFGFTRSSLKRIPAEKAFEIIDNYEEFLL